MSNYHYINDKIDISSFYDRLSHTVKTLIKEAEEQDKEELEYAYLDTCDAIEVHCKLLVPDVITKKEWELLCQKYS